VFFANYILPGVDAVSRTKLPYVGGDFLFAVALGILNTLIYPVLKLVDPNLNLSKIAVASFVLNFICYALVKFVPVGIQISTVEGYLFVSVIVSGGSFLTNYMEMKQQRPHADLEPPSANVEPQ
jgi:uncharacterized membrane protein YvlD (DUF360 family)